MSRISKRLQKFANNPVDVKWDQFRTIIEYYNLIVDNPRGGSHFIVYHPEDKDNTMIVAPVHNNRLKRLYVERIITLIETFEEGE
ncbi:MAG TPA: hypothetical protein GX497_12690 [Bacillus bacterium]|nr:hypothetical protein [Bacillus sp. (in: firmicutes)]